MIVFTIQDEEGNYASELSFQKEGRAADRWFYVSYTGRCDSMRYYKNRELAEQILNKLEGLCEKLSFRQRFTVVRLNLASLPFGTVVMTEI